MESSADSPRRSSSDSSSSLEFEFWMVGKEPSIPQPHLLTADELFVDGVLLPLHLLSLSHPNPDSTTQLPSKPEPETPPPPPPDSSASPPPTSSSKRWKDILKAGERKLAERVRKKRRRDTAGNAAELNINIWPFSRSRSAGNAGTGSWAKFLVARRMASSTPCSRSNSRGECSKPASTATATTTTTTTGRRWAPSPGRVRFNGGIHLGRTSPVWQLRRNCKPPEPEEKTHGSDGGDAKKKGGSGGVRMLDLNMNTCIRYRNPVSCSGEGKDGVAGGDRSTGSVRVGSNIGLLINLRAIFSKKVV